MRPDARSYRRVVIAADALRMTSFFSALMSLSGMVETSPSGEVKARHAGEGRHPVFSSPGYRFPTV
jgi:hypothetical protein